MRRLIPLFCFACMLSAVQADIYKCTNEYGQPSYSNVQSRGCKRIVAGPRESPPSPSAKQVVPGAKPGTPADFPRVDPATQRSRDEGRRRILDAELASEQKALDESRRRLAELEGGGIAGDVQGARDRVAQHQRNIEALRKELAIGK